MTEVEIKKKFHVTNNEKQLASLLNQVESFVSRGDTRQKKITARDLNYLSISKETRYAKYTIPKKNGKAREINVPDHYLKRVQFLINKLLQIVFADKVNRNTHGFLPKRNIVSNAIPHVNKRFILNIDIQDFFPSIEFRRVKTVLGLSPFDLCDERERLAFIIANIVTVNNALPQGAPTSPTISNIVTQRLDRKIAKYCKHRNIKYSRYADDLSFSANRPVLNEEFKNDIFAIIEKEEGFKVNRSKTRLRSSMNRQQVTGLVVNQKVNVKRAYVQMVRSIINKWEKGGEEYAQASFNKFNSKIKKPTNFKMALRGYIEFIGLVRGKEDPLFLKLYQKYSYLYHKISFEQIDHEVVRQVLIRDNQKMEFIRLDNNLEGEDKFISFCTSAFHQIENLLNFYYWRKFPDVNDFKHYMFDNNKNFRKEIRRKSKEKGIDDSEMLDLMPYTKISDFKIYTLVYLFEKEYYYNQKISYNHQITFLREVRNHGSHRSSMFPFNKQKKERLFKFLDERNYDKVRATIKDVLLKIVGAKFPLIK